MFASFYTFVSESAQLICEQENLLFHRILKLISPQSIYLTPFALRPDHLLLHNKEEKNVNSMTFFPRNTHTLQKNKKEKAF